MSEQENSELIEYRFKRALETIDEVGVLIENKLWNFAVNRSYYACYYAVSALLASVKIYPKSHAGTKQMFGLNFIKDGAITKEEGKLYQNLFDMRQDADYEDFVDYEQKDVAEVYQPARAFILHIQELLFAK